MADARIRIATELETDEAQGALGSLTDRVKEFAGPAAVGAAAAGLAALVNETLTTADELDALAQRTGLNVETLQRMGKVASRSGGDIEDVADAAREMQLRLAEAAALGSGPAVDALDLIGVSLDDLNLLDVNERFALLRQRISQVEDPAQRLFVAEELLGGSTERLNGLLTAQQSELDAVRVLTEQQVAAANDAHDAVAAATDSISTFAQQLITLAAPAIEHFAGGLQVVTEIVAGDRPWTEVFTGVTRVNIETEASVRELADAHLAQAAAAREARIATERLANYTFDHTNPAAVEGAEVYSANAEALRLMGQQADYALLKIAGLTSALQNASPLLGHFTGLLGGESLAELGSLGGSLRDLTRTGGRPSAIDRSGRALGDDVDTFTQRQNRSSRTGNTPNTETLT